MKYEIKQISARKNEKGVWTWKNAMTIGEFQTNAKNHKKAFLYHLHKMGIILKSGKFTINASKNVLEVRDRKTNEPIFAAVPIYRNRT